MTQTAAPTAYHSPDFSYLEPGSPRLARAALILGLVAIVCAWIPILNLVTVVGAVVGIVLGAKVTRQWLPGRTLAVWGIILSALAILGTVAMTALMALAFVAIGAGQDQAALSSLRSDALNYSISAETTHAQSAVYPATVTIAAGTVAAEFPTLPASENTVSFVNNGDGFVITVTNPEAAPDGTMIYDSLQGGLVAP